MRLRTRLTALVIAAVAALGVLTIPAWVYNAPHAHTAAMMNNGPR